jgi:hypothetical protein
MVSVCASASPGRLSADRKSFLVLFFKKELLSIACFPAAMPKEPASGLFSSYQQRADAVLVGLAGNDTMALPQGAGRHLPDRVGPTQPHLQYFP